MNMFVTILFSYICSTVFILTEKQPMFVVSVLSFC